VELRYASNDTAVAGYSLRDASRLEADGTDVRVVWGSKSAMPASLVGEEVVLVFELAGAAVLCGLPMIGRGPSRGVDAVSS
jgi:hypothetical protein